MGKKKGGWRPDEATKEKWAARDRHNREIAVEAVPNWYVGHECRHLHLPGDAKPHRCDCWGYWEVGVNAADEIWAAIALLTQRVDKVLERLEPECGREDPCGPDADKPKESGG